MPAIIRIHVGWIAIAFHLLLRAQNPISLADGSFAPDKWVSRKIVDTGGDGSFTTQTMNSGGNPGAFRDVTITFKSGTVTVSHLRLNGPELSYSPQQQGAISGVAYSYRPEGGGGARRNKVPACDLSERDNYACPQVDVASFGDWLTFQSSFAYAAAYLVKVDGPGPDRPDFSASGSTLYFGYITSGGSTSTYCGGYGYCSGGTWETGLDNLTVKLSPATAAPTGPVVCTIKPQNLFLAAHRPIHHLNDPRHPVHVLTVAATASGTPIKGAAVTLRASRGVFTASPSQPPSLNSLTSATDSNGRAAFGIDPPEATGFDRTDIVANVTSAGQTASCSAAVAVGLGTSKDFPVTYGAPGTSAHGQTDAMVAKIVEGTPLPLVASFSAASLQPVVARGSIVAAYGASLAASAETAAVVPLPVTLGGISVKVKDSSGVETSAPLFYAAPSQINYLVPQGAAAGLAAVTVLNGDQTVAAGTVRVDDVAPGLFAANGSGQGVAAAVGLRVADDQTQTRLDVYQCGAAAGSCTAVPRDLGAGTDSVFLLLFGTGIQNRSSLSAISATMGGVDVPVLFAGPQGDSAGLHRVNVRPIPATLRGRGEIAVLPTVDGKKANAITISIK